MVRISKIDFLIVFDKGTSTRNFEQIENVVPSQVITGKSACLNAWTNFKFLSSI